MITVTENTFNVVMPKVESKLLRRDIERMFCQLPSTPPKVYLKTDLSVAPQNYSYSIEELEGKYPQLVELFKLL